MSIRKNLVAYIALFLALGGTAYAGVTIGRDSVGTAQLKTGAVTAAKLHRHAVTAAGLAANSVGASALKAGSVTGAKIASHSLTASAFAPGTLPATPAAPVLRTSIASAGSGPPSSPTTVGESSTIQAVCPTGEQAVGGGFQIPAEDQGGVAITASMPLTAPGATTAYAWGVTYTITQAGTIPDVIPYAVCAAVQ
jgi:hypothetical protein